MRQFVGNKQQQSNWNDEEMIVKWKRFWVLIENETKFIERSIRTVNEQRLGSRQYWHGEWGIILNTGKRNYLSRNEFVIIIVPNE